MQDCTPSPENAFHWRDIAEQLWPAPAGAAFVDEWDIADGRAVRFFDGPARSVESMDVTISGLQFDDGSCVRWLHAGDSPPLSPAQARRLASEILNAADDADGCATR